MTVDRCNYFFSLSFPSFQLIYFCFLPLSLFQFTKLFSSLSIPKQNAPSQILLHFSSTLFSSFSTLISRSKHLLLMLPAASTEGRMLLSLQTRTHTHFNAQLLLSKINLSHYQHQRRPKTRSPLFCFFVIFPFFLPVLLMHSPAAADLAAATTTTTTTTTSTTRRRRETGLCAIFGFPFYRLFLWSSAMQFCVCIRVFVWEQCGNLLAIDFEESTARTMESDRWVLPGFFFDLHFLLIFFSQYSFPWIWRFWLFLIVYTNIINQQQ